MKENAERGREQHLAPVQSALRRAAVLPILPGGPFLMFAAGCLPRRVYMRRCGPRLFVLLIRRLFERHALLLGNHALDIELAVAEVDRL